MARIRLCMFKAGLLLALSGSLMAATPFEGALPTLLVETLAQGDISRELPAGFPDFTLPPQTQVMGALRSQSGDHVLLRTELSAADAQAAMEAALLDADVDWQPIEVSRPRLPGVPQEAASGALSFCHPGHGTLFIAAHEGVENRLFLRRQPPSDGGGCEDESAPGPAEDLQQVDMPWARMDPAMGHFPELGIEALDEDDLDSSVIMAPVNPLGGTGLPMWRMQWLVAGEQTLEAHHQSLQRQMQAQGWALDAQWQLNVHEGSSWTKGMEDGRSLYFELLLRLDAESGLIRLDQWLRAR